MDNQPIPAKLNAFNLKKLVFAPVFLIFFAFFSYELSFTLTLPNLVFSIDLGVLVQLIVLIISLILTSLFFVVFATLAFDWRLIAPISLVASSLIFIMISSPTGLIAAVACFIILCCIYLMLEQKLKSYLDFKPTVLLTPSAKNLAWFLIIISSVTYFLMVKNDIWQKGFQIPDSIIDSALKFMPAQNTGTSFDTGTADVQLPQIPTEQLNLLKQNPELLKQYGLDPKILDSLQGSDNPNSKPLPKVPPSISTEAPIKQLIKDQLATIIKPYQNFIAPILGVLFYSTLTFFSYIFSLFISPLIWLIFLILEKTGFIKFTNEQRTVKKMVV